MIKSLPLFHRIAGQKVLVLGDGEAAEPKKRLIERAGGIIEHDIQRAIDEGVRLAFVAYEDEAACRTAVINLRCAGVLVNVVDMPDLCDFTTPSILDRDPVLIAIGTGGASAGLAKHVRLRLDRMLPQSLGKLANALFDLRPQLRKKFSNGADRRRALDDAMREGGLLDPFEPDSHARVQEWLNAADQPENARFETISLTSSDPEDLTLRQARLLGEADTILIEGNIPDAILARSRADAARIPAADNSALGVSGLTVLLKRTS